MDCSLAGLNCIYASLSISMFQKEKAKKSAMPLFWGGALLILLHARYFYDGVSTVPMPVPSHG